MDADYEPDDHERYDTEVECAHACSGCGRYPVWHIRDGNEECPDEILCADCDDARAVESEHGANH